jgi:hypothetical protein
MDFLYFIDIFREVWGKRMTQKTLETARRCFHQIFPGFYRFPKNTEAGNEFFLDFETPVEAHAPETVVLVKEGGRVYAFLASEVWNIFHSDLSRSSAETESTTGIVTIVRGFRLPRNPYSNRPFDEGRVRSILSQLALSGSMPEKPMPEVAVFFRLFAEILKETEGTSAYRTTEALYNIFVREGMTFQERSAGTENTSHWKVCKKDGYFYSFLL